MTDGRNPQGRSRRMRNFGIAAVVIALVGAGAIYWFLRDDAPPEADLESTVNALSSTTTSTTAGGGDEPTTTAQPTTTAGEPDGGIAGTWSVDTSVGTFNVAEETTATFAGFRVAEVLSTIGSTTAVGRTPAVSGAVTIDGTTVTAAEIVVDLTAMKSDQSRREGAIQRALGTSANPEATFVLTAPIDLGDAAAAGDPVSVVASGELTINGTTNVVEFPLDAQLVDGKILIVGSTNVVFADYGVEAPTAPVVVSVEDNGTLEMQIWLTR